MLRIAVLCPSEIAFRRFMPALQKVEGVEFAGIAHASEIEWFGKVGENNLSILDVDKEKAQNFVNTYGGKLYDSFDELIHSSDVDAIYIPLPPALHCKWATHALEAGKNVLVEKPSTTNYADSLKLVNLAKEKGLALHENYMFNFHSQLDEIEKIIASGELGKIRLYRISFGFPFRGANDFRYNKKLGGGALLDCGGYTIKLALRMLGKTTKLSTHILNYEDDFEVDIYGSGTLTNDKGNVAQISFGMDNSYKCDLEVWGSQGSLFTGRVLTAPEGFEPTLQIKNKDGIKDIKLASDDSFKKSIEHFVNCVTDEGLRLDTYENILLQASLVDEFKGE